MHTLSELTCTVGTLTIVPINTPWILTRKTVVARLASQVVPQNKSFCLGETFVKEAAARWHRAPVAEVVQIAGVLAEHLLLPIQTIPGSGRWLRQDAVDSLSESINNDLAGNDETREVKRIPSARRAGRTGCAIRHFCVRLVRTDLCCAILGSMLGSIFDDRRLPRSRKRPISKH